MFLSTGHGHLASVSGQSALVSCFIHEGITPLTLQAHLCSKSRPHSGSSQFLLNSISFATIQRATSMTTPTTTNRSTGLAYPQGCQSPPGIAYFRNDSEARSSEVQSLNASADRPVQLSECSPRAESTSQATTADKDVTYGDATITETIKSQLNEASVADLYNWYASPKMSGNAIGQNRSPLLLAEPAVVKQQVVAFQEDVAWALLANHGQYVNPRDDGL